MPSFQIKLIEDVKSQLDELNTRLKDSKKEVNDLQRDLDKVAKSGQALDPAQVQRLAGAQNNFTALQQKQADLKAVLNSATGKKAMEDAVLQSLQNSKEFVEKIGRVISNPLLQKLAAGGEVRAGDIGSALGTAAKLVPGLAGKIAGIGAAGIGAGLQAATDIQDAQRAYARGEISRQELSLLEGRPAGLRNLVSDVTGGIVSSQAEENKELLDQAKRLADFSKLGRTRLNALLKESQGGFLEGFTNTLRGVDQSATDSQALFDKIGKYIALKEKQLGRPLSDQERDAARRQAAAEELEKGGIDNRVIDRITNAENLRAVNRAPPPVVTMAQRLSMEQAGLRREANRVPARIKD